MAEYPLKYEEAGFVCLKRLRIGEASLGDLPRRRIRVIYRGRQVAEAVTDDNSEIVLAMNVNHSIEDYDFALKED